MNSPADPRDDDLTEREAGAAGAVPPEDPAPTPTPFAGVPSPLAEAMQARGFQELTTVQQAVLEASGTQRDLRISSQTGSGKTVAIGFAVAASTRARGDRNPAVLVLVPTRELAMQVGDELRWLFADLPSAGISVVMGGTSIGLERRALSRGPRVIVGTPGRTLDHLLAGAIDPSGIEQVVLDESDRMLDMGFREELESILEQMPAERRTHLVSATFPQGVRHLADRFQNDALHVEGTRLGAANRDIVHTAHVVDRRSRYAAIVNLLLLNEGERCLVFVERRIDASDLATRLSGDGFPVQPLSGDLPQAQRTRTINAFRDGTIKTLISTDVAARGIDVPDIGLVIHADPPTDADTYVHRSGRTGRAGQAGSSVMLVPPRARRYVERVHRTCKVEAEWTPPPNAAKVRKRLRKRFRQQVHERLSREDGPDQYKMDYAKGLLDGRDPAAVVALLLDLAQPEPAREPMDVREAHEPEAPRRKPPAAGMVRFSINWGERGGAAINRILGHVCRRGDIRGNQVGAIDIGFESSTFDIAEDVATAFEKRVQKPDERDPKLRIARGEGHPSGRGSRPQGGSSGRSGGKPFRGKKPFKRGPRKPGGRR